MRGLSEWRREQDPTLIKSYISPSNQAAALLFVFGAIPSVAAWPAGQSLFELSVTPLLLASAPYFAASVPLAFVLRRYGVTDWTLAYAVGAALYFEFFTGCLLAFSGARVSAFMGALVVVTLLVHGYMFRYSYRFPWAALAGLVLVTAALPLCHSPTQGVVLVSAAVTGVMGALMLGDSVARRDRIRRENERLREALQAERLARKEHDVGQLSQLAVDMLGNLHDVGNALMVARLNADSLAEELSASSTAAPELKESGSDVVKSLARLQSTLSAARELGRREAAELARASVGDEVSVRRREGSAVEEGVTFEPLVPLLEATAQGVRQRFPSVTVALHAQPEERAVRVRCVEGPETLRRVFENLLVNACEGDGTRGATNVHVSVSLGDQSARALITFADDGPGFRASLLTESSPGLSTTKSYGTGLGLYTSERLVHACGGALERANRSGGGAIISVYLPYRREPS